MRQSHKIKGWFCWVRLLSRECRSWGFFPTCFNECSSPVGNCNLGQVSLISLFININQRKGIEWESRVDRRRQWHSTPVLLPGKSLGQRSLVDCSPWGCEESDTTERLHFHFSLSCFGEGNGNPLQCSCLENPRDREAWWAVVYGVAPSWTRLKRLSSNNSSSRGRC